MFTTVLSPMTDTALSVTVTGTSTLTIAWLPDAMPSSPLVVGASAGAAGAGAGAVTGAGGAPTTVLSPMTDTALSTMLDRGRHVDEGLVAGQQSVFPRCLGRVRDRRAEQRDAAGEERAH